MLPPTTPTQPVPAPPAAQDKPTAPIVTPEEQDPSGASIALTPTSSTTTPLETALSAKWASPTVLAALKIQQKPITSVVTNVEALTMPTQAKPPVSPAAPSQTARTVLKPSQTRQS